MRFAPGWIRTNDSPLRRRILYPLSYGRTRSSAASRRRCVLYAIRLSYTKRIHPPTNRICNMPEMLNPAEFTAEVADKLSAYDVELNTPEPLSIKVLYGENEPVLTLKLDQLYSEYEKSPEKLPALVQPLLTEVGWTVNGTHYAFADINEHSLPLMRDLKRHALSEEETGDTGESSKGPLLFQELVNRDEEHVIVQFVLAKNEIIQPLFTGDMLRSFPEPAQFTSHAVHNLRNIVLALGLTLSEFQVENFEGAPWLVGFRGGTHRQFLSSLITVPEVMRTLQQTLNSEAGLMAILPSRDQLLVTSALDENTIIEMGLLARYLKSQSQEPVSSFVWHFKDGLLTRVQTIDVREDEQK